LTVYREAACLDVVLTGCSRPVAKHRRRAPDEVSHRVSIVVSPFVVPRNGLRLVEDVVRRGQRG
jgi:hypothetical protein